MYAYPGLAGSRNYLLICANYLNFNIVIYATYSKWLKTVIRKREPQFAVGFGSDYR
jgi:hypothetical protein